MQILQSEVLQSEHHQSEIPHPGFPVQSPHGKPAPALARDPEERSSNWLPIVFGVVLVVVVVVIASLLLRTDSKIANAADPYAANMKFSDMKMSAAENFVGATVTYLDGTVTNTGDKTVSHAVVRVSFKDSLGQVVQAEDVPLRILQTSGPYPEAVDLTRRTPGPGPEQTFPPHLRARHRRLEPRISGAAGDGCGSEVTDGGRASRPSSSRARTPGNSHFF